MKTTAALLVAGSMLAVATPAMAQDSENFDGFRLEALAGYDVAQAGSSVDTEGEDDESIEGLAYGVGAGYDFDAGGVVLGLEAEYVGSTGEVDVDGGDPEGFGLGTVSAGRDLYLGGRIGVKANDDLLVYAKGGYTNATFDVLSRDGDIEYRADIDTDGYRVGAGLEYALSGNTFAKVEYRYSNYSDAELDFEGDAPDVDLGEIDLDRHQVMAGFGMRF
ncbi:outer membrane beta-barrel protein [Qipengyuania sp. 1NDH17]|uniref:Outer membrane beta-barrel protein n=1 Tax=Qipengyuania polymorpha TaxID=2867234 RepID=A0ABS7IUV4_9SPHN|nr:outer membrane beta-barrel protein [Qipengyuania polymorpha]MBX7457206.1 outer membrane beta-barrel protein [Qipengyuania polymorpha]